MPSLSSHLIEAVFRTVKVLPPASIVNVAEALETDALFAGERRSRVLGCLALPQERAVLALLLTEWESESVPPDPTYIAVALRSALHTKMTIEKSGQVELVWTGPSSNMMFRRTDQALLQVIQAAQRELLIVTFAAYRVPLLRDAIRRTVERGVTVRFVAESAEESGGKVTFDAANALRATADQVKFYVWPGRNAKRML
jgi:phosphatidylserine/phosphatidylglycerophosphate/cardiolipin synthase-like enzyme